MKCPTLNCGATLPDRAVRIYCKRCRSSMGRYAKKGPGGITISMRRMELSLDRIHNIRHRKDDIE